MLNKRFSRTRQETCLCWCISLPSVLFYDYFGPVLYFPDFPWHVFCTSLDLSVACEFFSFTLSLQSVCFSCLRRSVTFFKVCWFAAWRLFRLRLWWSGSRWWNIQSRVNLRSSPVSSLGLHVFLVSLLTVEFMSRVHETMRLLKPSEILNSFIVKLSLFLSLLCLVMLS